MKKFLVFLLAVVIFGAGFLVLSYIPSLIFPPEALNREPIIGKFIIGVGISYLLVAVLGFIWLIYTILLKKLNLK